MDIRPIARDREQRTCLTTLYGKAMDAGAATPVLGDAFAAEAVRRIDFDFRSLRLPATIATLLATRAKRLDDWVREFVAAAPEAVVLNLGCGLDARVHRVAPPPGVRWYDVDRDAVLDVRRRLYPARDGYRMIAASLADPALLDGVETDRPVAVVAEGVLPYLPEAEVVALFGRIGRAFPGGCAVFDAYSRFAISAMNVTSRFGGTPVSLTVGDPRVAGLTLTDAVPLLALPELAARTGYRAAARVPGLRNAVRLLRYRFTPRTGGTAGTGSAPR